MSSSVTEDVWYKGHFSLWPNSVCKVNLEVKERGLSLQLRTTKTFLNRVRDVGERGFWITILQLVCLTKEHSGLSYNTRVACNGTDSGLVSCHGCPDTGGKLQSFSYS